MKLEDYDTEKGVQALLNKNPWIKIIHRWDFKENYLNKGPALVMSVGGCNIAIAGMRPPNKEQAEFYVALKIINAYVERLNGKV